MTFDNQENVELSAENGSGQEDVEADNAIARVKHPLEHTWTWWLYRDLSKKWDKNLIRITSVNTVEDFWCLYHHMKLPSEVGDGQYSIFKSGMRPAWEDVGNRRGGRWLISLDPWNSHEVDRIWTDMVLLMIGENFGSGNVFVCGAVVNAHAKHNKRKLAIWVSNKNKDNAIMEIGLKLKEELKLPFNITFHAHNSNQTIFSI